MKRSKGTVIAFIAGFFLGNFLYNVGFPLWAAAILGGGIAGCLGALADIYIFNDEE